VLEDGDGDRESGGCIVGGRRRFLVELGRAIVARERELGKMNIMEMADAFDDHATHALCCAPFICPGGITPHLVCQRSKQRR